MKQRAEASSTSELLACDVEAAMKEIDRGHELMTQLRALLIPLLPAGGLTELAGDLFEEILKSSTMALSRLRDCSCGLSASSDSDDDRRNKLVVDGKRKSTEERERPDGRRRRKQLDSWSIVTSVPHYDGHQWRKYGQKTINNAKYPRSYYRCTNSKDQGCRATKTVQQEDRDSDPPKFLVTYSMQHTCKNVDINSPFIVDSAPRNTPILGSESEYSLCYQPSPSSIVTENQSQGYSPLIADKLPTDELLSGLLAPATPIGTPGLVDEISNIFSPLYTDWDMMMDAVDLTEVKISEKEISFESPWWLREVS
ncbi:probable WRKY transcription factor 70 [Elaeis guineensis]|uniref:Probable WRKY transcription factor 70 n=1 Tax=Elaeis guineensis var. tenera TaxID=51953 RepID=A0A6I9R8T7_ELAGV|nr:probable WRKY transcription factor 70 [Elaeis guineensis]